jgi:hypothetical protein
VYAFQGGVGISEETLRLMLDRLFAGKAYHAKVKQIDEKDTTSEEVRQVWDQTLRTRIF